jgi:hypothetical protein
MTRKGQAAPGIPARLKAGAWIPPGPVPCTAEPDAYSDLESLNPPKDPTSTRSGGPVSPAVKAKIKAMQLTCDTRCPFVVECLESALAEEGKIVAKYRHGIRGGKTPSQRETIARKKRVELAA